MIIDKKKHKPQRRQIDLSGTEGNAYVLLGYAKQYMKAMELSKEETEAIHKDMTSSDYEHLIQTFDKHFGSFVDLIK